MDSLREEIECLKKLGESWNMEKYQIEAAILKAIADKNGNFPTTDEHDLGRCQARTKPGCCMTCVTLCCYITVGVVLVGILGACLYTSHSSFEVYVNRVVGDLQYPVLRRWRLLLLPLKKYIDLQHFSVRECLVDNPWYTPEDTDCEACQEVKDVPKVENVSDFANDHAGWGSPIIVTDVSPYAAGNYTLDSFLQYYQILRKQIDADLCEVSSLDESVNSIDDYFKVLRKLGPETPNIRWKICYGEGLRAIRKFFPKPYFVSTEGALEKFLIVVNSDDEIMPLPTGQYSNAWLAQTTGASEIQFKPPADCNTTCPNLNATLNKGEVMFINQELWDGVIVGNPSDEPAVVLFSTFA